MLALQCSYVEGEGESMRKHVFHVTGDEKPGFQNNFIIVGNWGLWKVIFFYPLKNMILHVTWLS